MTKTISIGIALIALAIALFFMLRKNTTDTAPLQSGPIVAFGDSLVYGYGASAGHDFVSVLSQEIGQPILNRGINGETTAGGLARVETIVALKPSIVLLLLGGNDFLRGVPATETFDNLEMIVEQLQASGARVVLLGIQGGVLSDPFAAQFAALAREYDVAYVPNVLAGLVGNQTLMYDTIHPNDAGYRKLADKVLPILESVLH